MSGGMKLLYSGRTVALSRQAASALADELWNGSEPGSLTSAVKLVQALGSRGQGRGQLIEFDDHEARAIARALEDLGLLDGSNAAGAS